MGNLLTGQGFALRLLPPGDGSGGLLVATRGDIQRLDNTGATFQTYDVVAPPHDGWFALNLDPDGTSFWSGDFGTANFQRFDIASTAIGAPINTGTGGNTLFGLCVLGEPTAAQVIEVMIDVKLFSNPDGYNCNKKGVLPVTIFGMDGFDVSEIDLATVELKLADGTPVGGPVVDSRICDRGDPDFDKGTSTFTGQIVGGICDGEEFGTQDGEDDIDVRFDAQTVSAAICPAGTSKGEIIPQDGLVIMGELNDGTMFTSVPFPDVGIDQLLVQNAPR